MVRSALYKHHPGQIETIKLPQKCFHVPHPNSAHPSSKSLLTFTEITSVHFFMVLSAKYTFLDMTVHLTHFLNLLF